MIIKYDSEGNVTWIIYVKQYKKARYRKKGQRLLNYMLREFEGSHSLIIVK